MPQIDACHTLKIFPESGMAGISSTVYTQFEQRLRDRVEECCAFRRAVASLSTHLRKRNQQGPIYIRSDRDNQ
ncbi:hypothetical protein MPC4_20319 [Methylocella tundrae]|uniref:Transposase n=1 Tax=Methylocella tundrae TaxID=227605 RepID=A0A8B6M6R4_METTU|nr:hypothetical protein MPC4_20319 [Methylocella tundrae]